MRNIEGQDSYLPKVTIVTVVKDNLQGLVRTMQSVFDQTYPNIEYIVIDGGSAPELVAELKKRSHQIHHWISERDHGPYDAMNKGLANATGEWINFMNAGDCFSSPDVISEVFKRNIPSNTSFIYGHYFWESFSGERTPIEARPLSLMWQRISFSHQSLFSKVVLLKQRPFSLDYKIASDYDSYFYYYSQGYNFYNSDVYIADFAEGGISSNIWLRTWERWSIARKHSKKKLKVDKFYLKFFMKEVLVPELRKRIVEK